MYHQVHFFGDSTIIATSSIFGTVDSHSGSRMAPLEKRITTTLAVTARSRFFTSLHFSLLSCLESEGLFSVLACFFCLPAANTHQSQSH